MRSLRQLALRKPCLLAALLLSPAASAVDWPTAAPPPGQTVAAQSLRGFAGSVAASSGVTLALLPAAPRDAASALASGAAAVAVLPLSSLERDDPALAMGRVPYLATSFVDARKLWQVLRPQVERVLAARGLNLLYAVPSPPPAPLSTRPLTSLAQWRGATLVVSEPALEQLSRALGAQPVNGIAVDEALRSGKAQAAFQSAQQAAGAGAWEYAGHYLHAPAWFPMQLVVVSRRVLAALAPAPREAVLAAAREAQAAAWQASEQATAQAVQKLRDYGVKTAQPSVALLIQLEAVGRDLLFHWSEGAGETGAQLVEGYYALR